MGRRIQTRLTASIVYTVVSVPLALAWLVAASTMFGTAFGLVIIGIGLPLLSLSLRATSVAGHVERWIVSETLGEHIDPPVRQRRGRGVVRFFLTPLQDPSYWKELAFVCVRILLAPIAFSILVATLGLGLFGVSVLLWGWWEYEIFDVVVSVIGGIGALTVGPLLLMAITSVQVSLARALIGPDKAALTTRADTALRNRDLSVTAAEAERQRIERDLHDGAQARLATVALDLGRAKRRLEKNGGDHELGEIISSAHNDAKQAIVELRNLARGIHPAVLTDRGLDAALSDVAARCTVPVHLDVHLLERPPAHIESAGYFAVSELLTNITKHSRASKASVVVRGDSANIRIQVSDDGLGGADYGLGSGLVGLHERITSLDGTFTTNSPLAGGTTVQIEIPLNAQPARR